MQYRGVSGAVGRIRSAIQAWPLAEGIADQIHSAAPPGRGGIGTQILQGTDSGS